jgi:hypothetical protein
MTSKPHWRVLAHKADVTRVDGMVQAALAYAKPIVRGGPATDGARRPSSAARISQSARHR